MTATIHRTVPPQRLITAMNPFVRLALRSPLHRLLNDSVLMLHVVGRSTGHRYDIPVGFTDLGDRLITVTQHRWRRNLRGGVDLDITRFGRRLPMHAELDEDPTSVAAAVRQVLQRFGAPAVRRRMGIVVDAGAAPSQTELVDAIRDFDLGMITLTKPSARLGGHPR
ncbi:MAG TPA: hypothetical protein VIC62_12100 [Nakamurella sp.]